MPAVEDPFVRNGGGFITTRRMEGGARIEVESGGLTDGFYKLNSRRRGLSVMLYCRQILVP